MSTLSQFVGSSGAVKSVQSGAVYGLASSAGSGNDTKYADITITAVDPGKCLVMFTGGFANGASVAVYRNGDTTSFTLEVLYRLTSATNLRLHSALALSGTSNSFSGTWQVIEFY